MYMCTSIFIILYIIIYYNSIMIILLIDGIWRRRTREDGKKMPLYFNFDTFILIILSYTTVDYGIVSIQYSLELASLCNSENMIYYFFLQE